jgi:hypothetical protein
MKNDDGTFVDMLQLCRCAKIEETKLIQMSAQIGAQQVELKNLAAANALFARRLIAQGEDLRMIFSHTAFGGPATIIASIALIVRRWWKSASKKMNRQGSTLVSEHISAIKP